MPGSVVWAGRGWEVLLKGQQGLGGPGRVGRSSWRNSRGRKSFPMGSVSLGGLLEGREWSEGPP